MAQNRQARVRRRLVVVATCRGRARPLEAEADPRAPLPRLHRRRRDASGRRGAPRRGIPRGVGVLLHYAGLVAARRGAPLGRRPARARPGAVRDRRPPADPQRDAGGASRPASPGGPARESSAASSASLASRTSSTRRSSVGLAAFEVFVGIFFVLATAAYWIFERKRARTSSPCSSRDRTGTTSATPGS